LAQTTKDNFSNRSNCYNFQFSKTKLQDFVDLFWVDLDFELRLPLYRKILIDADFPSQR